MSVLDELLAGDAEWRQRAACRGVDPRIFYDRDHVAQALRICRSCTVVESCLQDALDNRREGVWGNTTDDDRRDGRLGVLSIVPDLEPEPEVDEASDVDVKPRPPGYLLAWLETVKASGSTSWARLHYRSRHSAGAMASQLRTGARPSPAGRWSFEAAVVANGTGSHLYVRYEGEGEEGPDAPE